MGTNEPLSGANVTISVDCFNYLGGKNRDAALMNVYSVSNDSGLRPWHSRIMIQAVEKGVPVGK